MHAGPFQHEGRLVSRVLGRNSQHSLRLSLRLRLTTEPVVGIQAPPVTGSFHFVLKLALLMPRPSLAAYSVICLPDLRHYPAKFTSSIKESAWMNV